MPSKAPSHQGLIFAGFASYDLPLVGGLSICIPGVLFVHVQGGRALCY